MTADLTGTSRLALLGALLYLLLGGVSLWLGLTLGAILQWGFGVASLLQVPPAFSLRRRIRDGLGNSGLEGERVTLRVVGVLLRGLALVMAVASVLSLRGGASVQARPLVLGADLAFLLLLALLWHVKQGHRGQHPTLDLDASRSRVQLELGVLLFVGGLLESWFPEADGIFGLAMALRIFIAGRGLSKSTALAAASCGSCGSCGCG